MRKRMYLFIAIFILLLMCSCSLAIKKSVRDVVIINTDQKKVWNVLLNVEDYERWNPTMKYLKGKMQEGKKITYQFSESQQKKYNVSAKVLKIEENKLLNQKGGVPFILTFNHKYILEPVEGEKSKTKCIIHEEYRGIGVLFWNPNSVLMAYQKLNKALKDNVEN